MVPLVFELALLLLEVLVLEELLVVLLVLEELLLVLGLLELVELMLLEQEGRPLSAGCAAATQLLPLQLHHMQCTFSW
jgi:hypothetical protein